ncbi:MAG: hypothetical protein KGJ78_00685 [Alphaproteobacteria bacterium]|nr:hypothetical protein [Alphaproteobacteria bacterium]
MTERAEKPKARLPQAKSGVERNGKAPVIRAPADPHDPLLTLLRDTYAQRACEQQRTQYR